MSLNVKTAKTYDAPAGAVFQAALDAIGGLEGKVARQDSAKGLIEATFDKKILGKVLGDRSHLDVSVTQDAEGKSVVAVDAYPLDEIDHGRWETRRRADVESQFPQEYADWEADPFTFAPEGGESGASVIARALPVIRQIVLAHPDEVVAVVSHKATIRLIISSLLGFDVRGYRDRLDQLPACLNVLDFRSPTRTRLMLFNDVSHYAEAFPSSTPRLSKWWDTAEKPDGA